MARSDQLPERSRSDRILDAAEIGLWLVLLVLGGIIALESMRQRGTELARPEIVDATGYVEAENLRIRDQSYGIRLWSQSTSSFRGGRWAGNAHLFAKNAALGVWVEFELIVDEPGPREVVLFLTRARDYGIVQVSVDGEPLGEPIDLWTAGGVTPSGAIELGRHEVSPQSVLRLEVVGTNDRSSRPHHQFGIDGVRLRPGR